MIGDDDDDENKLTMQSESDMCEREGRKEKSGWVRNYPVSISHYHMSNDPCDGTNY